jgi:hypothetical protein
VPAHSPTGCRAGRREPGDRQRGTDHPTARCPLSGRRPACQVPSTSQRAHCFGRCTGAPAVPSRPRRTQTLGLEDQTSLPRIGDRLVVGRVAAVC